VALGQSAELLFRISGDPSGAVKAINTTEAELKGLDAAVKRLDATSQMVGGAMQSIGAGMQSLGRSMTAALTAPIAALAALGVRSALSADEIRTKVTALVGDVETANKKIAELTALAERSVGVTRAAALESFTQLRGIGGVSDDTINSVIQSLGKLNAAFKIEDLAGFQRNLNQIFAQGFERADIKEAIGRVPFFEQLLEQAFGTKDADKLRKMKEAGELTMDSFLAGLSNAIEGDPRIANISENLSTQLSKGFEKLNVALAPLGEAILKLIVPALNAVIPYVQRASEWFASLSPAIQTAVLAALAFVAAIGPTLVILGGIVSTIGSLITASGALGIALLAVVGLFLQLGPILVVIAAQWTVLYKLWTDNAGGIRDATERMFAAIQNTVQTVLATIQRLWETHGERILTIVRSAWNTVNEVIESAGRLIGSVLRTVMDVIRGDWENAWDGFVQIVENGVALVVRVLRGLGQLIRTALAALIPIAIEYGARFVQAMHAWALQAVLTVHNIVATLPSRLITIVPRLVAAGAELMSAVYRGMRGAFTEALSGGIGTLPLSGAVGGGIGGGIGAIRGGGGVPGGGGGGSGGGGGRGGSGDAEQRERERLRGIQERIEAEIRLEEAKNARLLLLEEDRFTKGEINEQEFLNKRQEIEGAFYRFKLDKMQEEYDAFVGNARERFRIANEMKVLQEEYQNLGLKYSIEQNALDKKNYEEAIKHADEILEYERQRTAAVFERLEAERKAREAEREKFYNDPANKPQIDQGIFQTGIFDDWKDSWMDFFGLVMSQAPTLQSMFADTASILQNAFQGIANAIGSVIEQWVLYGQTGPAIMRKILAAALASIAAEAAVRAIYELAAGFAALFFNPAEAAAHFTAAALFGSIAVGAALAGRAIAGDSFKRQTSAATGGASGSSATQRDTSAQGGAFSDKKEITIEAGRYTPFMQRQQVELTVKLDSNGVLKVLEDDARANGKFRGLVLNIAEG
jgi:tape measure domain-containing protein